jgi:hypothetical protein
MLERPPSAKRTATARERRAANARRLRRRRARGQRVFRVTAHAERVIDLLCRHGYLVDGIEHDHSSMTPDEGKSVTGDAGANETRLPSLA